MSNKTTTTAMMEEAPPALVPKLRFPEFRGAEGWERKKVGNMLIESPRPIELEDEVEYCLVTVKRRYGGLVSRGNLKGNEIKVSNQFLVHGGDFLISKRQIVHDACGLVPEALDGSVVSNEYSVLTPRDGCSIEFFNWFAQQPCVSRSFLECSVGIVIEKMLFKLPSWLEREFLFPPLLEQQKVAACLSSVDELVAAQARKVAALKTHKKGLMQQLFPREGETQPRLRFPEFQNAGEWEECTVEEITATVTPPKKLQTPDYQAEGEFPIVDQSQNYICGWTNDSDAVIDRGLPVIIFGDHTCALKFIDCPFAQGADGIKILRPKRGIDIRFLFCALEADPVVQESYKRHFSMLKEKKVFYPDPKTGEQQRIATCLSSLDALITAETQKHEALKTHKKGLMQQLFPSPEEPTTL